MSEQILETEIHFDRYLEDYLESQIGLLKDSTIKEQRSKIHRISKMFDELVSTKRIDFCDPKIMSEKEIRYIVHYMKNHDISPATQKKYVQLINNYLIYLGNPVVASIRRQLNIHPPKPPIEVLEINELKTILNTIDRMKDWRGCMARGMIYLSIETLARPDELRTALIDDIDMRRHRFFVRNPKGKGSFASSCWVDMIRPDCHSKIDQYLIDREAYLLRKGITSKALFPNINGENGLYSANAQRELMRRVSDRSNVDFCLKMIRPTITDMFVTDDPSTIYLISAQLRHSNIETTQRYYADIQKAKVASKLGDRWKHTPILIEQNTSERYLP